MTPRQKDAAVAVMVVALAVGAAAAWMSLTSLLQSSDFLVYYLSGADLARGLGYLYNGMATAIRTPGYSVLLAMAFRVGGISVATMLVVNLLLQAVTAALAYILGLKLTQRRWVAALIGVVVAVIPDRLYLVAKATPENLAAPLLLGIALCWVVWRDEPAHQFRYSIWIGLLLGALTLTRPITQALVVLFALLMLVDVRDKRRAVALAATTVMVCLLVLAPWLIRNQIVLGSPVLTTSGGGNLLMTYNPGATGMFNPQAMVPVLPVNNPRDELVVDGVYRARAVKFVLTHPAEVPRIVILDAKWLLYLAAPSGSSLVGRTLVLLSNLLRLALSLLVIVYLFVKRDPSRGVVFDIALLCALLLVLTPFAAPGSTRYLVPQLPCMVLVGGIFVSDLSSRRRVLANTDG